MSDGDPLNWNRDEDRFRTSESGAISVLQVNKLYYPQIGGVETVVRNIARGLANRGHDTRVLASVPRGRGWSGMKEGVKVRMTASLGRILSVPIAPSFPVRLWQEAKDADIVHHHLPNPLSVVSHYVAPSHSGPTVATYHSDIVRQKTALRTYAPILQAFLHDVDRILVTSPRLLGHSRHLAPHTEKCTIVPPSIDLDAFGIPPSGSFELPIDSDRPVVLFVGRLNYYKGVQYLIEAMEAVDASLLIVGDGKQRASLEKLRLDYDLADDITFMGEIPDGLLHYCYDIADVFVLPSVEPSEAFGIVQLEAMAYETPVVNTNLPTGVPWVSPHGETGLTVPPRDSDALATAIRSILEDDRQRRILGRNARKRVVQHFSRERMLSKIESVYANLLED